MTVLCTNLCTNLLALRARELADMIEALPRSLAPDHQYACCCELLEQLAIALDLLAQDTSTPVSHS